MGKIDIKNVDTLLNDLETLQQELEDLKTHSAVKQSQRGKLATTILSCQQFLNEVAPLLRQLEQQAPTDKEKIKEEILEELNVKLNDLENGLNEKLKSMEDLIGDVKQDQEFKELVTTQLEELRNKPEKTGSWNRFKHFLKSL